MIYLTKLSTAQIIQRRNDRLISEKYILRDVEGFVRGIIQGTIPVFTRMPEENHQDLCQNRRCPGQDLGPPDYETGELITQPRSSVSMLMIGRKHNTIKKNKKSLSDQLSDCQILKKASVPRSQTFYRH
jgi:hypothetical protein